MRHGFAEWISPIGWYKPELQFGFDFAPVD
jgi:hypothetical protein